MSVGQGDIPSRQTPPRQTSPEQTPPLYHTCPFYTIPAPSIPYPSIPHPSIPAPPPHILWTKWQTGVKHYLPPSLRYAVGNYQSYVLRKLRLWTLNVDWPNCTISMCGFSLSGLRELCADKRRPSKDNKPAETLVHRLDGTRTAGGLNVAIISKISVK